MSAETSPARKVVITPPEGWLRFRWQEMWQSRDLFLTLALQHIQVRYRQAVLGWLWAVLQPLIAALTFTLVFSGMVGETHGVPYLAFAYSGMVAWLLLASLVNNGSLSLVTSTQLITKVYFPRLLIPLSVLGFTLLDFFVGSVILVVIMVAFGLAPTLHLLYLPLVVTGIVLCGVGVSVFLAALTVKYRDFKFVVPFMLQLWLFLSPIIYPVERLPDWAAGVVVFNPMTGWLRAFRHCLFATPVDARSLTISVVLTVLLLLFGLRYFRQTEDTFSDIV